METLFRRETAKLRNACASLLVTTSHVFTSTSSVGQMASGNSSAKSAAMRLKLLPRRPRAQGAQIQALCWLCRPWNATVVIILGPLLEACRLGSQCGRRHRWPEGRQGLSSQNAARLSATHALSLIARRYRRPYFFLRLCFLKQLVFFPYLKF